MASEDSRYKRIARVLLQTPGMRQVAIAQAIGETSKAEKNGVSAALCTMLKDGRAYHNGQSAHSGRRRWFAHPHALDDRRHKNPSAKRTETLRKVAKAQQAKATGKKPEAQQPKYGRTPILIKHFEPAAVYAEDQQAETVEQFLARGGQIEMLKPNECSPAGALRRIDVWGHDED